MCSSVKRCRGFVLRLLGTKATIRYEWVMAVPVVESQFGIRFPFSVSIICKSEDFGFEVGRAKVVII